MTAEQLRNSILQEAISGRLVPQDPNDEPASVLLERMQNDKRKVIPIQDEDMPYEIPGSWEWVNLGSIVSIITGKKDANFGSEDGTYDFFTCSNTPIKCKSYSYDGDYLIMPGNGANIGKVIHYKGKFEAYQRTYLLQGYGNFDLDYLKYHLMCNWKEYNQDKLYGSAIPYIKLGNLMSYPVALPPLAEQKRIVAKLEELLPIVEQYGKAQTELDELNAALPARLRQSILQQAISGRLVPQDENETADGLKEHLLQAVNISPFKKKWNSEPIEEDEVPFDIPENWKWIRLGDIVYTQTGLSYSKGDLEKKVSNPIRVLRGGNIQSGSWRTKDDDVMIAPEFVKKDIFLKKNSFITPAVTSLEHLGKTALIREDHNDIVAGGFVLYLMPYDDKNDALMEYLAYFFQSAFYNSFCKTITNKSGQAFWNISREKLLKLPIPLPPLAEQQRIVAKIEELFEQIDQIKK